MSAGLIVAAAVHAMPPRTPSSFIVVEFADRWARIRWSDGREEKVSDERLFKLRRSAVYGGLALEVHHGNR